MCNVYIMSFLMYTYSYKSIYIYIYIFEAHSFLKFTFEIEVYKTMPFLVVIIDKNEGPFI